MLAREPDLFVHSGDMIYADNPLLPEVRLPDGRVWKNIVTPAKTKVAETLDEFRGNYAYNLLDEHVRRFNAAVPMLAQWDDHEVTNNWHPGLSLERRGRYTEKSLGLIAARARRAMFEYVPFRSNPDEAERVYRSHAYGPSLQVFMLDERSYRGPNGANREADARRRLRHARARAARVAQGAAARVGLHMERHRQRPAARSGGGRRRAQWRCGV